VESKCSQTDVRGNLKSKDLKYSLSAH